MNLVDREKCWKLPKISIQNQIEVKFHYKIRCRHSGKNVPSLLWIVGAYPPPTPSTCQTNSAGHEVVPGRAEAVAELVLAELARDVEALEAPRRREGP